MAPSATAHIILASCLFFLPLSFLTDHVTAAASPPFSFSFDFSNTSKHFSNTVREDLRFEGEAALKGKVVDLTCNPAYYYCSGRMSYNYPVPLYDNNTGEVASFVTTFTFAINLSPNTTGKAKGDGMAFFLSGYPSRLLPDSQGPLLGLTNKNATIASGADRFLAVEFDTYSNAWDPRETTDHIGIDLSSISSVGTTRLPSYSLNGTMTATITFDNTTRTLEATLHFDSNASLAPAIVKAQLTDQLNAFLPPEVAVGFSATTGGYFELHQIHSWTFNSTMAGTGANRVPPEVLGKKGLHGSALIIGGAVILGLALLLVIWLIVSWCSWKLTCDFFGGGSRLKRLKYRDLSMATQQFSDTKKIGEGGFSLVYRGILNKKEVAVKKIIKDSGGNFKDFLAELDAIDRTLNVNVVRLEGWCCSTGSFMFWCLHRHNVNLFLVYEFVPNGNLHQHLHEKSELLSWEKRYKIVKGLLSALHHLHHECSPYILHRDIKPKNILLDYEFNAKLGDFGLSRVAQDNMETSLQTTVSVGTAAYMDPDCKKDGHVKFRRSSDVYSFGIVLLEIAHGKYEQELFWKLHTDRPKTFMKNFPDEKLAGNFDKTEMERVIVLGLRCSERDENKRPSLSGRTLQFLENGGDLAPPAADEHHTILMTTPVVPETRPYKFFQSNNLKFDQVYRKFYQRL